MEPGDDWRERIVMNPAVHHGEPCIRGTRVPVSVLIGSLAEGSTVEAILASYPQIIREDIFAAVKFAAARVDPPRPPLRSA
ncbi:MAG: hypothetical protein AMXMBFR47_26150 [Planctomycetota bacterium]